MKVNHFSRKMKQMPISNISFNFTKMKKKNVTIGFSDIKNSFGKMTVEIGINRVVNE